MGGIRALIWVAAAALAVPFVALYLIPVEMRAGLTPPDIGHGPYRLQTTDGKTFEEGSLKGAPSLVFFGYSHCPDVCPTTLGDVTLWLDALPEGGDFRLFMITVDPARDTPEVLARYLEFLPQAVGVSGSTDETNNVLRAFRAFAARSGSGENYTMDHSASVYVFDANAHFTGRIPYQAPEAEALEQLRAALAPI